MRRRHFLRAPLFSCQMSSVNSPSIIVNVDGIWMNRKKKFLPNLAILQLHCEELALRVKSLDTSLINSGKRLRDKKFSSDIISQSEPPPRVPRSASRNRRIRNPSRTLKGNNQIVSSGETISFPKTQQLGHRFAKLLISLLDFNVILPEVAKRGLLIKVPFPTM